MTLPNYSLVTDGLGKQIAENIREAILSGHLKVDERLPTEEELASRFQVSRPTIREALKRLAAQNIIRSRRGPMGGTFVARPSQEDLASSLANATTLLASMGDFEFLEIVEARYGLETICSRLAALRRDNADMEAMQTELAVQKNLKISDIDFCASDVRFHTAIIQAAKNPVLSLVMASVVGALQPITNMVVFQFRELQQIIAQHERLFESIKDQNPEAAVAAVTDQIAYLREIYVLAQGRRRQRDVPAVRSTSET
jgi:DNA-binding FadR family transcriptional regulator